MKCEPIVREMRAELIRQLKLLTKEELKLVLFWLMVDVATILGILFALFVFYQPLLTDLYNCDIRDPFNLQEGWLLWAIIGVIFANTATFGTTFATKYFSKRLSQPKTKYSIDTGHGEQDRLTGSPKRRILMWSVMVALLLLQVVEEYVYRGYLMALLTKWLVTTIVVVICSFIIAFVHWKLEQVSHLFTGVLAFGLTYAKTHNPMTAVAMHFLLSIVHLSVTFITFMRRSFSRGIVLLQPAKEVSYRARRHKNYGNEFGPRKVFRKRKEGNHKCCNSG
ncbi:uncharacterized protein LOC141653057 isoform X1 [Silene latifolia]|uniref:uncharacterized protein LOC141653057 isoform X1 n=1 Tax=Silene latifolia TaxID=37657 RepID=UPI003D772876